ncbi:GNAT family N-acetyltransferase [Pseudonocardia spinosispora]|uniref:GNAT family N-acetyltransferase n=1 Tax=Pseudonocardia spinosispora TaxID=103441 RepID=UPI00040D1C2C|nr:GNAT family N-acetyltransferase [Pseudonocardia spinosispora]
MTVRQALTEDLDAIGEIYAHYVRHSVTTFELDPPDRQAWRARFDAVTGAGLPFLVAELDGAVAGYAYCTPWKPRPAYRGTVENSIYVAPWATRRRVGAKLLDALLVACPEAGVREVIAVIVDSGDPSSVELHRRHGFVEAGRLAKVGIKHGFQLDTMLYQRSIG